jgi:glycosyltransferase involved in cell wall biosynthesis
MRIGFLTPEFVTERYFSGGLANYIYRISLALVSMGHEIHVITLSEEPPAEFEHQGIYISRINNSAKRISRLNRFSFFKLRSTMKLLALSYSFYAKLKQLHTRRPFDIVQYANYNSCGLVSSILLKIPFMLRFSTFTPAWHEHQGVRRTMDMRAVELLERLQLMLSGNIYAPSHALKRMLEEKTSAGTVRVLRTPFFLETDTWDSSVYEGMLQGKQYLLFFGRLQLHKGIHVLAEALPRLFQANPECYAAIVGMDIPTRLASSMKDYLISHCAGFADRLIFIGQIPHEQLYPVIQGARVVVLPSLIDNLPNACLEAMALGKPVVGTLGASFEEMIADGESGFLVPPNDSHALGEKLCEAWKHPRLDAIGRAAKIDVQAYAPEETVRAFLAYAQSVVEQSSMSAKKRERDLCSPRHSI